MNQRLGNYVHFTTEGSTVVYFDCKKMQYQWKIAIHVLSDGHSSFSSMGVSLCEPHTSGTALQDACVCSKLEAQPVGVKESRSEDDSS